jgi:hypothetical protein
MAILITHPELALLPALLLFGLYRLAHRPLALWVAVAWLLYGVYEYGMKRRVLCSGECDIRVDLLAIYPALAVSSVSALVVTAAALRRRSGQ